MAKALLPDLKLSESRERDIDPEVDLIGTQQIVQLANGTVGCLLSASLPGTDTQVFVVEEDKLTPVPGLTGVSKLRPAQDRFLVLVDQEILLVDIRGKQNRLISLDDRPAGIDFTWRKDGLRCVTLSRPEVRVGARLFPAERELDELRAYAPQTGWRTIAKTPSGGWSFGISDDGSRCAWLEPCNSVPEEAMRGEFKMCDLATGEVRTLTDGAGQARGVEVSPDGSGVVYQSNFQVEKPITTHTDLWWQSWEVDSPKKLTSGGRYIEHFDWLGDRRLWVAYVDGVLRSTEIVEVESGAHDTIVPVTGDLVGSGDDLVCETGDVDHYPFLSVKGKSVEIPQIEPFEDLQARIVDWEASDGLPIRGVIYESENTPDNAPLLLRAHGGPAGDVEASRRGAVRHRHLLRAGYRILEPAFRGSLGFGDEFLGANIRCQGVKDLDDIVTGVDCLVADGVADPDRVGIFGRSYGGYMTLRALAVTDRFKTGVALYGFIDNRWMTLETGDFTYEDEYIAPVTWPLKDDAIQSDVFSHMHEINCPVLLLHGDQDPICALSQSKIVYSALRHRGVETGLVVYPGEGHGFRKPGNRQDCARRTLAWFEEFLPV